MPRTARIAPKEYVYHVMTRGNNRQRVFDDDEDFLRYLEILQQYRNTYRFQLYHYVLMSNHVHLVLQPSRDGGTLAQIMKGINLTYAWHYKKKYQHVGHFWQDRYKSIIVLEDAYLLSCGSYVELNPIRAGMVRNPQDYPWSSYGCYASGKGKLEVELQPGYQGLGHTEEKRQKAYREFVGGMLKKKNALKGEMDRRLLYGSSEFVARVGKKHHVSGRVRPVGRPKMDAGKIK